MNPTIVMPAEQSQEDRFLYMIQKKSKGKKKK